MRRLAVMAQFDPRGMLGPHVRRHVELLAEAVDDLVVVSTSELTAEARTFLAGRTRLVQRENTGYDFMSYREGLLGADLASYDEVTICNDSCVTALRPWTRIYADMQSHEADFWGLTETDRIRHHVQSFFVTFRRSALEAPVFADFWGGVEHLQRRGQVIRRYEVGLSRRFYEAGLTSAAYFTESEADRRLARRRVAWWALHRTGTPRGRRSAALLRERAAEPWNPSIGLADRALDDARLPYVKIDTLRYDPYGLGADRLLDLGEQRFPAAFEGVRGYLADTAAAYPPRADEVLGATPVWARPLRRLVEYGRG